MRYHQSVNEIVSICHRKNLLLNPKKSKEMCFNNINIKHEDLLESKNEKVNIHGSEVERTSQTDYLGVCIEDKLTFKSHISKILRKVYFTVSSLAHIVSFFNKGKCFQFIYTTTHCLCCASLVSLHFNWR